MPDRARIQRERTGRGDTSGATANPGPRATARGRPDRVRSLQDRLGNRGMQEFHRRGGLDETVARRPPAAEPEPDPDSEPERRTDGAATGASGSTADDAPTDGAGAQRPEATTDGGAAGAAGAVSPTAPAVVGETAAGPDGAAGGPELLMPEPPTGLSDEERARLESTSEAAGSTAEAAASLPPGEENVSEAREAVSEPEAETQARVENDLVEALGERPAPSPEIEELCARIYEVIRSKRPPDEESLVEAEPEEMAQEAGGQLDSAVRGDTERVRGEYDRLEEPPSGTPQQTGGEPPAQPGTPATPDIGAADAVPDGVSEKHVDLSADVAAAGERMDEAGMTGEAAQLVESGPIADARAAHGELESTAEQAPARVLADQQAVLADARADMTALQASAVQALVSSRRETAGETQAQQEGMVRSEEQTRERISERAQEIFSSTQDRVLGLLEPLPGEAMEEWQAGVDVLSTQFERSLQRVERWVDERYSGAGGAVVELWDDVTGMPDWVTEEYDRAEQAFGDGVCALIRKISADVNGVIAACEALIEDARTRIDRLFTDLPDGLADWASEQRARFDERLNGLHQQAMETRDDFTRDLTRRAAGAVQEVRTEVHALRQEARGLLGQFQDAVTAFLDDPARAIINGLLQLAGIPPASFWAVVDRVGDVVDSIADDPMNFANNLLTALKQGFQGFFDRFGEHVLDGLLDWLFSGLGSVGVEIPTDFSLTGVITFFLQLMGLTWDRIREILARHIGEENVALLERAYEVVSTLVEQGPPGVYAMLEDQLNPQTILDQVIQAATDYLVETLIQQATVRIIALLNPAGAIVQAVEAVYRVLDWVFTNAARIFSLVETVVNGAAALVRGDTSGMAGGIESALAGMIPTAIDFLAGYLGLGDLPETIAETIRGFQEWVLGFVDRAVGFIAGQARRLLQAIGLGGEETEDEGDGEYDGEVGDTVTWSAEGESHRLWVEASAGSATVMMASGTGTDVDHPLQIYRQMAAQKEDPVRSEVIGLIEAAIQKTTEIEGKAAELASKIASGSITDDEKERLDSEIETDENSLKQTLKTIEERLGSEGEEGKFNEENEQLAIARLERIRRAKDVNPAMEYMESTKPGFFEEFKHRYRYEYLANRETGMNFQWPLAYLKGVADRRRGKEGERDWVEAAYGQSLPSGGVHQVEQADGSYETRIPDFIGLGIVGDVKDVATLPFTAQLRDFYTIAKLRDPEGIPRQVLDSSGSPITRGPLRFEVIVRGPEESDYATKVWDPLWRAADAIRWAITEFQGEEE